MILYYAQEAFLAAVVLDGSVLADYLVIAEAVVTPCSALPVT
jgi:hypothetical protein